jgi:hypothetical protein
VFGIAREIAERLRDHRRVEAAVAAAPKQTSFPRTVHWHPPTLAQGDAGIALACAYLDACFPNEAWDRAGHHYLTVAAEGAESSPQLPAGMFSGLAGLAFAGWSLSRHGTRYERLLTTLDNVLLPLVIAQADIVARHTAEGLAFGEFDAISGLAGMGAYLLHRRREPGVVAALETALRSLVVLAADTGGRPRWWTPAHLLGDEDMAARHPYGNLNCGLAHGIPGPLGLIAMSLSCGITVPGLEETIDRLVGWLVDHQVADAWGVNWPYAVSLTSTGLPEPAAPLSSRAAWCYGAPGVARALWLAGVARNRSEWRNVAIQAMEAVYRRPIAARYIDSPTFCHGVAGLLQITLRFAKDTGLPVFSKAAADLTEWLLSAYEPDTLLGYRNWEPGGTRVDQPGLLDGAPGVLLTLLAAASDVEPSWDRIFLLA